MIVFVLFYPLYLAYISFHPPAYYISCSIRSAVEQTIWQLRCLLLAAELPVGVPQQSSGTRLEIVSKKMADPIAQASHFDFQIV